MRPDVHVCILFRRIRADPWEDRTTMTESHILAHIGSLAWVDFKFYNF